MATVPARRRKGLARQVLDAAVESAREAGCSALWLEVVDRNAAAVALYRARGFARVRDLVVWSLPAVDRAGEPTRAVDEREAQAWIAAHREEREPWQRADGTLARLREAGAALRGRVLERSGEVVGAVVYRDATTVNAFQLSSFTPAERAGANAFFALAWSAANAVGAVLSGAIRARLGPDGFTFNLVTLGEPSMLPILETVDVGEVRLVGAGAIGQAAAHTLALAGAKGMLVAVDPASANGDRLVRYQLLHGEVQQADIEQFLRRLRQAGMQNIPAHRGGGIDDSRYNQHAEHGKQEGVVARREHIVDQPTENQRQHRAYQACE